MKTTKKRAAKEQKATRRSNPRRKPKEKIGSTTSNKAQEIFDKALSDFNLLVYF